MLSLKKCGGERVDKLLGEKYKGQRGLLNGDGLDMIRRELGWLSTIVAEGMEREKHEGLKVFSVGYRVHIQSLVFV